MPTKVLIIGSGSIHNNYTGVDGLANSRIPLSYNLKRFWKKEKDRDREVYFCNVNEPHAPYSVMNGILKGLRYESLRHIFTRQMSAIPISPEDTLIMTFDVVIAEMRPKTFSYRYHFKEQYYRMHRILSHHQFNDTRVIIWDMDEWHNGWADLLDRGAKLATIYNKEVDTLAEQRHVPMWSWDKREFKPELEILDKTINREEDSPYDFWYCGNTYGRENKLEILNILGASYNMAITGNWVRTLNVHSGALKNKDFINHVGPSDHVFTIPLMHHSLGSIIIGNPKHVEYGLIACRVFEAQVSRTPIIIDSEYDDHSNAYKGISKDLKFSDGSDLIELGHNLKIPKFRRWALRETDKFIASLGNPDDSYRWFMGV